MIREVVVVIEDVEVEKRRIGDHYRERGEQDGPRKGSSGSALDLDTRIMFLWCGTVRAAD